MNYGEAVNASLNLLDEYSSRGVTLVPIKTADLRIKMPDAINQILMDLAVTTGKLNKEWMILNSPVCNETSRESSIIKNYIPGTDDIVATQTGARSYFLEVSGHYHVMIEEQVSEVWTTLVELQPDVGNEPAIFTELKGLLSPTDQLNPVRIRLTGDYPYPYRNYILYPYNFPSDEDVQQHRSWLEIALPDDWLKLKKVMIRDKVQRTWKPLYEYRETPTHFCFNRYAIGEISVEYYRKPALVVVEDPANPTAEELEQVLDATPDAVQTVPYGIAGTVVAGYDTSISSYFLQLYENRKFSLIQNDGSCGIGTVISVTGW